MVRDDKAVLGALDAVWADARKAYPKGITIFRVGVTLYDLSPANERQMDMLLQDDRQHHQWEAVTDASNPCLLAWSACVNVKAT